MPSTNQHSDHRRLRRALASKSIPQSAGPFRARSPQFGGGRDRDRIDDRIGDRIGQQFGSGAEDAFNRWRERVGGGWDDDGPSRGPGRGSDRGPPVGRPDPGPPFGRPNPGPPAPVAPSPTPQPTPPPTGPNNGQTGNSGASPGPGDGSSPSNGGNNNGGSNNSGNQSTSSGGQSTASPVTSAASRGTDLALGALPASLALSTSSDRALASSFSGGPNPLETSPTATAGPMGGNGVDAGISPTGGVSRKGLSGPIIAVIVILSLLFLVVLMRRRWITRRSERLGTWWVNRRQNSRTYGDYPNEKQAPLDWNRDNFVVTPPERSASPLDLTNIIPTAPPMAEVRRLRNGTEAYIIDPTPSERFSGDSFVVNHSTLLSHRTSDTESFKFPKPPSHSDFATVASIHSRLGSSASNSGAASVTAACGHTPLNQSQPSLLGSQPPLTPSSLKRQPSDEGIPNPFADGDGSESIHNPFASNSVSITPLPLAVGDLSRTERIRRPFLPTMADELSVEVDEEVKIVQIFDDGWALVEKAGHASMQGLIPLACLRDIGQGLTSLLNTRRVQSVHVSEHITE